MVPLAYFQPEVSRYDTFFGRTKTTEDEEGDYDDVVEEGDYDDVDDVDE